MSGIKENLIIVRGGGDLATGTVYKLHQCGFPVLVLETANPSAIRRNVAFCEAVYQGSQTVEGVTCLLADSMEQAEARLREGRLTMLIDPVGACISHFQPLAVVDAILAKKNLGTSRAMAPITVGLGPGFTAGVDVDAVVETKRGHHLGKVLYSGAAAPNTGVPGIIGGYGAERVLRAPAEGVFEPKMEIGRLVKKGEVAAVVNGVPMLCTIDGCLRGLLQGGLTVAEGMKCGDIDPRCKPEHCLQASDKALSIGGGVLEALLHFGCLPDLN